jgi:hypothetical protein
MRTFSIERRENSRWVTSTMEVFRTFFAGSGRYVLAMTLSDWSIALTRDMSNQASLSGE